MAFNPAKVDDQLNDPTKRANNVNDPQFENTQGYYPFDLTHQEFISPRFGEVTPSMVLDTVSGDRIVVKHNSKCIHNQINANFLSTVNQYIDDFYVPLRSVFPQNYEKLIPNPTKGSDLPNSALPQVPFCALLYDYMRGAKEIIINDDSLESSYSTTVGGLMDLSDSYQGETIYVLNLLLSRLLFISTILSRGQLLDYLGCSFGRVSDDYYNHLQKSIDTFHSELYQFLQSQGDLMYAFEPHLTEDVYDFSEAYDGGSFNFSNLSEYRDCISTIFERGSLPVFVLDSYYDSADHKAFHNSILDLINEIYRLESSFDASSFIIDVNTSSDPFRTGFISLVRPLAYQQVIAQYYTNDSVDNIFNSELYMQSLRSIMYPANEEGFSSEPTFLYNGVTTEYDYISCGGFFYSLLSSREFGSTWRQVVFMSTVLMLRRSLRYGDKFSTARPRMLAVGDLSIPVDGSAVSPIDVTKNLLMQRYLNAVNYIGSGFLNYMSSIFGIKPSDTGTFPRFVSHHKISLDNQVTNNTADDQGKQTTNLVGFTDDHAFDVFIDDIGVLLSLHSYDVLPVYNSGIDEGFHFSDRFDYFNPMLQNIGDQAIRLSEILGDLDLRDSTFGFTMRNAELKYKVSRAHGAFVNSLPGHILTFPTGRYVYRDELHIDPEFIRDRPLYFDRIVSQQTGISPGEYFHFVVAVTNDVKTARLIQATPPVLF